MASARPSTLASTSPSASDPGRTPSQVVLNGLRSWWSKIGPGLVESRDGAGATVNEEGVSREANKWLSIKRLPPVLSIQFIQFKRFEQRGTEMYKIDTPVRVPLSINMAPYTTAAVDGSGIYPGPEALYDYELFALINHEGQIDNGHYTSFARFQDTWCRFDDDKVTPATLAGVLYASVPIYMAFYVKRRLDYKPHTMPSYVLLQENEAVREREREREALLAKGRAEQEQAQAREQERAQAQAQEREMEMEQAREREVEDEDELLATVG